MITLLKPIITEQSLKSAALGKFTFMVAKAANKIQISQEIAAQFKVHVLDIKTLIVKGKTKRTGRKRQIVKSPDWKKAVVTLKSGEKIDLFEVGGTTDA